MNEEDFVTLEVAKLLKNKGFNKICDAGYFIADGEIAPLFFGTFRNKEEGHVSGHIAAPTLYEAQKWLREKHNCYIQVTYEAYKTRVNYLVQVLFYEPNDDDCWSNKSTGKYGDNAEFDSFENALNFGISEALKRI